MGTLTSNMITVIIEKKKKKKEKCDHKSDKGRHGS